MPEQILGKDTAERVFRHLPTAFGMRIQGAMFYTLEQSRTEGGHLYMEAGKLLDDSLTLLQIQICSNWRGSRGR